MNLDFEQMDLLKEIGKGTEVRKRKSREIEEQVRLSKADMLKPVDRKLAQQVKDALDRGVPKRQINAALGSSSPTAWRTVLERGGLSW